MSSSLRKFALAAGCMLFAGQLLAAEEPKRPECIAPASPGGGFDLTCKLVQSALINEKLLSKPMRVTYMPGGVGAVAYNKIVANDSANNDAIVAFSTGSLLNLAQGKFGQYTEKDVRWLAAVGISASLPARRSLANTANTRTLPDSMCGPISAMPALTTWMWLPSTAVTASPPPSSAT